MGDFACLIASMDWRSIKRHQCLGVQHTVWIYLRWIDPLTSWLFYLRGVIRNKKRNSILEMIWKARKKTVHILTCAVSAAGPFCLFSVCKHASGCHRGRPEGNIRLIYWSLFSPSSIAGVWWPGYRGTIWQRRRWRRSWAWRWLHWQALIYRPDLWLILCT